MSARNLYIPADLWRRMQQAAADESAREGRTVSVSEWLREAARRRLARETETEPHTPTTTEA